MLVRDICEDHKESLEMSCRAWNRSVMSGRISQVPELFKRSSFQVVFKMKFPIYVYIDIVERSMALDFKILSHGIGFDPYIIHTDSAYPVYKVQGIINSVLGINITDVHSRDQADVQYHAPSYNSEQLRDYIKSQVTPWLPFIKHHDSRQNSRFNWLQRNAGRSIPDKSRQFLLLKPEEE